MDSNNNLQVGDWLLILSDKGIEDRLVAGLSWGEVVHAAIVATEDSLLETDGAWFKAKFSGINKYANIPHIVVRPLFYPSPCPVGTLCQKYEGSPYSYWHIATDAIFSPFAETIRRKIVWLLSWKKFMVCSELVARITFEATGYEKLKCFIGYEPEDLRRLAFMNPKDFLVVGHYPE